MLIFLYLQVKNFILLGDVHKSIYFLSWKEQGSQLNLLAKDFGSLDCFASEFLIDGSTLSLAVSDEQKNFQVSISLIAYSVYVMGSVLTYMYVMEYCEILLTRKIDFLLIPNRYSILHQRWLRAGRVRNFFQGRSFMWVRM